MFSNMLCFLLANTTLLLAKNQRDCDSFLSLLRDGLENSGPDLDAVLKFLENSFDSNWFGSSPERRQQLFEVLIIGRPLGKMLLRAVTSFISAPWSFT